MSIPTSSSLLPIAPHQLPCFLLNNHYCPNCHQVPLPPPYFLPDTLPVPNSLLPISLPIHSLPVSLTLPLLWLPHTPTLQLLTNSSANFPHNPVLHSGPESLWSRPASSHHSFQPATSPADTDLHPSNHLETQVPKDFRAHPQVNTEFPKNCRHLVHP